MRVFHQVLEGKDPITIDGKQYSRGDFDELTQDRITTLAFVDTTIKNMNFEIKLLETLRLGTVMALRKYTDDKQID
jgi:hypothetical protein